MEKILLAVGVAILLGATIYMNNESARNTQDDDELDHVY